MSVVKALAGGLIGGTVGAYGAELISPTSQWPVLLAGVLAGIGVRVACRSERSFITGVTAAVAVLLAISGVSYRSAQQASKAAEQSMAEIPVKSNYKGDAAATATPKELSTDDADQADPPAVDPTDSESSETDASDSGIDVSDTEDSPADGTEESEIEVTPVDSKDSDQAATDQAGAEVAELNEPDSTANMPDDQRPAQRDPSADPWVTGQSPAPTSSGQSSLPKSVMLFHGLAALAAFVLGSGSAPAKQQ